MLNIPTPNIRSIEEAQNYLYQVSELINNTSFGNENTVAEKTEDNDSINEAIRFVLSQIGSKYVSKENLPNLETDPTVEDFIKAITTENIGGWNNKLDAAASMTNADIDDIFSTVFEEE